MRDSGEDRIASTIVELQPSQFVHQPTELDGLAFKVEHRLEPQPEGGTSITYRDMHARQLVVTTSGAALVPQAIEAVEKVDRALLTRLPRRGRRDFTTVLRQLRQS